MIQTLTIQNFVLIHHIDLSFKEGLIVLSGETGAGKSLILKALEFVGGAKIALKPLDESKAITVSASFHHPLSLNALFEEQGIDVHSDLLLRRTLLPNGTSKTYVNDTPVSLAFLKNVCGHLLEFVGQFETLQLIDTAYHLHNVDAFAQNEKERDGAARAYDILSAAQKEYAQKSAELNNLQKDALFYEEGAAELEALAPEEGEEAKLIDIRRALTHSEKILTHMSEAHAYLSLDHGALKFLYAAEKTLLKIPTDMMQGLDPLFESLGKIQNEVSLISDTLENHKERFLENLPHLENLDDRLHALRDMARKYKVQVDDLKTIQKDLEHKLKAIQDLEKTLENLEKEKTELLKAYQSAAKNLSLTRAKALQTLEKAVNQNLSHLHWKNASFHIAHEADATKAPNKNGFDTIVFKVQTNLGSPADDIAKVASGGERSRLLLALKTALMQNNQKGASTLIFDEIDTGVGGATAEAVGKMLQTLSSSMQVLLITHAPQVAALSKQHFFISKNDALGQTTTKADELSTDQKQEEIARMLSGKTITPEARAAAKKLMVG